LANETTAVNHKLDISKAFGFALLLSEVRLLQIACPEESDHTVAHENVYFSGGNYKGKSSKLADENAKITYQTNPPQISFIDEVFFKFIEPKRQSM